MKKVLLTLLALYLALCPLALAAAEEQVTLNVYNWGDYIDPDTLAVFEERTGIRINYELYETNEDMYTKLKKSKTSYDVIFPSDYMVERMIHEEMLLPLDYTAMPYTQNIDPRFLNASYDPTHAYSVPYTWGTMGILYNTTMVDEAPADWDALWDARYDKSILMLNSPRDTIGIALKRLGHSLNSINPTELEEAKQSLIAQSALVLAYVVDEGKDKMVSGEAALALVWSGDAQYCIERNPELAYVVPPEGSNLFFDAICVPTSSKHPAEAMRFIDFLCEADIAAQNYEYVGYAIPNSAAVELMGDAYAASAVSNPPDETLSRCEVFTNLGDDTRIYDRIWTEIITSIY
ncbi:MAG: ABC transporter substrate-binding protein [Oscillospiraceae bacterium]|jgi:spermidine/putrescine transport system substrate-binding protein|nr:ABC transporter substrate-binding protein [Oscillospiraceae bacterium]